LKGFHVKGSLGGQAVALTHRASAAGAAALLQTVSSGGAVNVGFAGRHVIAFGEGINRAGGLARGFTGRTRGVHWTCTDVFWNFQSAAE